MSQIFYTASAQETEALGYAVGKLLRGDETIAYFGGLGMGKTTFTRGIARALDIDESDISSPTFALVHEHSGKSKLCHFDMYRVETWDDLYSTGFFDYLGRSVLVIEWSENIENALPDDIVKICISQTENDGERRFEITGIADIGSNFLNEDSSN